MTHAELRSLALAVLAAFLAVLLLASCGTTRALPAYEPPLSKREFQDVRTTAYTDSEADHTQYGARNALGGELHAATPPIHRAEVGVPAISLAEVDDAGSRQVSNSGIALQPFSMEETKTTTRVTTTTKTTRATPTTRTTKTSMRGAKRDVAVTKPPSIGSAAADWSRWPMGTTFRLLSTGQVYRVEDYGWALSGRNTIDLYMASQRDMNLWGARQEPIQVLQWGDPQQSLQFLQAHQDYKHIKRMVLELQGRDQEAAALR